MRPLHIFFAVLVAALWGANFVAAEYGVAYFPPFFFSLMRFVIVSALLIPFVPRPTTVQMWRIAQISVLATFHFSLLFVALSKKLDISSSALIGQLGVPFSCLLGAIFLKDRIGWRRILGIVIAFAGIAVIAGTPNVQEHQLAFLLAIGSSSAWAVANLLIKRVSDIASLSLLAWMSLFTLPWLFLLSLAFEGHAWMLLAQAPLSSILGLSYTVLGSTLIAYGLWYFLLSRYTLSQVTPISLLTPVFGIAGGEWFFNEALTIQVLAGGIITILGVAIIVMRQPKLAVIAEAT